LCHSCRHLRLLEAASSYLFPKFVKSFACLIYTRSAEQFVMATWRNIFVLRDFNLPPRSDEILYCLLRALSIINSQHLHVDMKTHKYIKTLSPTKYTIFFPDISYYNITLNTPIAFDLLWEPL
jgi:hypothetical protein